MYATKLSCFVTATAKMSDELQSAVVNPAVMKKKSKKKKKKTGGKNDLDPMDVNSTDTENFPKVMLAGVWMISTQYVLACGSCHVMYTLGRKCQ